VIEQTDAAVQLLHTRAAEALKKRSATDLSPL
jgi:hypothetical protein